MADTEPDATSTDDTEPTTDTSTDASDDNADNSDSGAEPDGAKPDDQPKPTAPLGDAGKRALEAERKARRLAEQELKKLRDEAARNAEATKQPQGTAEADTSEVERLAEQLADLQEKHAAAELKALRHEVASTAGVPADLLTATTETELAAQAQALSEWAEAEAAKRKPKTPDKPADNGGAKPKERLRSGAASSSSGMSREDILAAVVGKHRK